MANPIKNGVTGVVKPEGKKMQVNPLKQTKSFLATIGEFFQNQLKPPAQTQDESNIFVSLFGQKNINLGGGKKQFGSDQKSDSLIETIVEQSERQKANLGQRILPKVELPSLDEDFSKKAKSKPSSILFWTKFILFCAFFFPLAVYVLLYFQTTTESSSLNFISYKNMGATYAEKQQELNDLNTKIAAKKQELEKLIASKKANNIEKTMAYLKDQAIDWVEVMDNLNEVTNKKAVKYNEVIKRIKYTNYAFDAKEKTVSVSAEITDPNQQVFSIVISLLNAISNSVYFQDYEIMRSFTKTLDEDGASTSLSLQLQYIPKNQRTESGSILN